MCDTIYERYLTAKRVAAFDCRFRLPLAEKSVVSFVPQKGRSDERVVKLAVAGDDFVPWIINVTDERTQILYVSVDGLQLESPDTFYDFRHGDVATRT